MGIRDSSVEEYESLSPRAGAPETRTAVISGCVVTDVSSPDIHHSGTSPHTEDAKGGSREREKEAASTV